MASYSETDMGSQWCKDIHNMYDRSGNGLNPEQHLQIARLINRNLTSLSSSPTDFGKTSILKHAINTALPQPKNQIKTKVASALDKL